MLRHVPSRPTTYCNGNERGGYVIFAFFKYDDLERILFMLGPIPTHHNTNCEQCSCFCSNCRTDPILTTPKPEPTRLLLRMVGHLRRPPIDGLIVRQVDEPPAVHHNATGIVPNEWSWAPRAHEVLRQKLSNGITFSAVRYNTRIKSNQITACKPTEQIRRR